MQADGSGFRGAGGSELVRLRELGEFLRRTRESLGLTIEEAVEATKVRGRYLTAIEHGDLRVLPGKVYARGFVRSYAEYLGLDGDEVTNLYLGFQRDENRPLVPQSQAARRNGSESPRPARRRRGYGRALVEAIGLPFRSRSGRFGLFTLAVVVFTALSLHYEWGGSTPPAAGTIPTTQPTPGTASGASAHPGGADPAAAHTHPPQAAGGQSVALTRLGADSSGASYHVTGAGPIRLKLTTASGRCWTQVVADGKAVFAQTIAQGQTITFSARQSLKLLLGAAPVVKLTVDGLPVPPVPSSSTWVYNFTFLHRS